jgi:hypothetical protein
VTSSMSPRTTERQQATVVPLAHPFPDGPSARTLSTGKTPPPRVAVSLPPLASISGSIDPATEPSATANSASNGERAASGGPPPTGASSSLPASIRESVDSTTEPAVTPSGCSSFDTLARSDRPAPPKSTDSLPPTSISRSTDPPLPPTATPNLGPMAKATISEASAPRADAKASPLASVPRPTIAIQTPKENTFPYSIPVGSILLYENFSHFGAGNAIDWGPNTSIRVGQDHRYWLVPNAGGAHPVGRKIWLPSEFCLECRYSAYTPEVTRGLLGWWKEPLSTTILFQNDRGSKYAIEWIIKCGNDLTRLNPLGSSSLYAKKYYHTIKLPGGMAGEVGVVQPTGVLRIDISQTDIKAALDGQTVLAAAMSRMGQLVGFQIDLVNTENGTLAFTDFKIGR